ncbi:MAG: DinB family protein [Vicinamibacterales bacterium]
MERDEREHLIAEYEDGYRVVSEALLKITPAELDAKPAPNKWSARDIVHHLADSEAIAAMRFRRLLAEDHPVIHAYDQEVYAKRLHYYRPYEASLELFHAARTSTVELMGTLTEAEWLREGTHSEMGRYGFDTWLRLYAVHAHKHASQIMTARSSINMK